MTPLQLVLGQRVCIWVYAVACFVSRVCVKFSVFQNFNKGVKFFSIIDLVLFVRLHFQLLYKILFVILSPENGQF